MGEDKKYGQRFAIIVSAKGLIMHNDKREEQWISKDSGSRIQVRG